IQELFSQIMSISRKKQYGILAKEGQRQDEDGFEAVETLPASEKGIVYQGVEGAYSQMAVQSFFGSQTKSFHVKTWRDAMEALKNEEADYAVLPIENSTAGLIAENHDLLVEYEVCILGEQIVEINHALLGLVGTSLSDIRKVYSHPQAILQCSGFLRAHPEIKAISLENTALAAKKVKQDGDLSRAAIAGEINAELYGLSVLQKAIQDVKENKTRFIIAAKKRLFKQDATKISICFELPHESGSLYHGLSHIILNGLNMTRIVSRPIPDTPWQYRFFVDFLGNLREEAVKNALFGLREETINLKILGNY
ncbi:MAG: prephenate dehydratase, partial [Lachnospiraceae bacterium]|nr:prephenate dehydratase [Lachnospiraceae bacterium]